MSLRNWEQDYADGRFDFLDQPHEQLPTETVVSSIED